MAYSIGLIGCGEVAQRYAVGMDGAVEGLELQGVWDINPSARQNFSKRFFGVKSMNSFKSFISQPFDLVCVCTPNNTHSQLTETCLKAGFDVLVEHPLSTSVVDAERICRLAREYRRRLFVMRQRRFLSSIQLLRQILALKLLGDIRKVTATLIWNRRPGYFTTSTWRQSPENGGVVLNQASHFLDILLYLFGEHSKVEGVLGNIRHRIPVEDTAKGAITFSNGVLVEFACTIAAPPGCNWGQLTITGSRGSIMLDGKAWERVETSFDNSITSIVANLKPPLSGDHIGFLQRVVWRLSGKNVEVVDGVEGMRSVRLIDHIYRSFKPDIKTLRNYFLPLFEGVQE